MRLKKLDKRKEFDKKIYTNYNLYIAIKSQIFRLMSNWFTPRA
jgi:hypothetical protein